jgi:hypothetical protein
MTVLTNSQREAGLSLASQEGDLRWAWGDWALKVAPASSEYHDDSLARLREAHDELVAGESVDLTTLIPSAESLRLYRSAALAIPPKLRTAVRSLEAGRSLGQIADVRERHRLIEALKNEKGIVTVDAVRAHFGNAPKGPDREPEPEEMRQRKGRAAKTGEEKEAEKRIKDSRQRSRTRAAEGKTMESELWKIVAKMDEWRRDMDAVQPELDTLSDDGKERIAQVAYGLRDACQRWLVRLGKEPASEPEFIEGEVVEFRGELKAS